MRLHNWWSRNETLIFVCVTVFFLVLCLVGVVVAVNIYSPDAAVGPLSAWIPGTVTALALVYTLRRQRSAEERSTAENFHVWVSSVSGVSHGRAQVNLDWTNLSDTPIYGAIVELHVLGYGVMDAIDLGVIPPRTDLAGRVHVVSGLGGPEHFESARPMVTWKCTMTDGRGHVWQRDEVGELRRLSGHPIKEVRISPRD